MILKKGKLISKMEAFEVPVKQSKSTKLSVTYMYNCMRMAFYKLQGQPQKESRDPKSIRIADNGTYMHYRYIDFFQKMGILKEKEKLVFHKEKPFLGYIDAIVDLDGEDYVVELKSIAHSKFAQLREAQLDHKYQLRTYMYLTGIKKGLLLYEDKDTQDLKEFEVTMEDSFIKEFEERLDTILNFFNKKELPERVCANRKDGENHWCPYVDVCFAKENESISEEWIQGELF